MPTSHKPIDLKKLLINAGFEIFRVQSDRVHLAERVRDNLIMDGGVCVVGGDELAVRVVIKTSRSGFPNESDAQLFERTRSLGALAEARGYAEVDATVVPVRDPSGGPTPLDTWYEVTYQKKVSADELLAEVQDALALEKTFGSG